MEELDVCPVSMRADYCTELTLLTMICAGQPPGVFVLLIPLLLMTGFSPQTVRLHHEVVRGLLRCFVACALLCM